jgi:hypothetical protein
MPSGIEFFLTHRVRDAEDDYRGWEWYVVDSERLHQDMLQILLNESPEFRQNLIGHDGKCKSGSQLFGLIVGSSKEQHTCLEIKVDQRGRKTSGRDSSPIYGKHETRRVL